MKDVVFFLHKVYPKKGLDDIDLRSFDRALSLIKSRFKVVPLEDILYEKSPVRRAAITFDDGYVDNWVYAYPILKKHGVKAHLFVTTGRIGEGQVRKNLEDYWRGKVPFSRLYSPVSMYQAHRDYLERGGSEDYLTWEELEMMKDVFSFGSHGHTHLALPSAGKITDFFDGSKQPHWTFFVYSDSPFVGLPVFPTRSALDVKAFKPSVKLLEFCYSFPKVGSWKKALMSEVEENFTSLGSFETDEEARKRILGELQTSKELLEKRLGVKVDTFSYPFGHYSSFSRELVSRVYRFAFTVKKGFVDSSEDKLLLPRVSVGKDLFTLIGRLLFFSTGFGFRIYKLFKGDKVA